MVEESISRGKFIRLGAAFGVGAAGVSLAAACGGGSSGSSGGDSGGESAGSGATSGGGGAIAEAGSVVPGTATTFTNSGEPAVLVHLESGDFVAYSAVCPHQGCTVDYQQDSGQLACPCHGSAFDPADSGAVLSGPADRPLPDIPVEVQNGEVVRA